LHIHLAKVVLAEFTWQTFKSNQRFGILGTKRGYKGIKGRLSTRITIQPGPTKDLDRFQVRLFLQEVNHPFPEILDQAGPSNAAALVLGNIICLLDFSFFRNSLDGSKRHA